MDQPINDTVDAQRYRAFRWVMCASEEQQDQVREWMAPLMQDDDEAATPELLDAALDLLAAHLATL